MASKSPREILKEVYPHKSWWIKVDRMPDSQVFATLIRLRKLGKVA